MNEMEAELQAAKAELAIALARLAQVEAANKPSMRKINRIHEYMDFVYPRWASKLAIRHKALSNNATGAELDKALQYLIGKGKLESRVTRTCERGRPPIEYRLIKAA
jgi:hypothetical protein